MSKRTFKTINVNVDMNVDVDVDIEDVLRNIDIEDILEYYGDELTDQIIKNQNFNHQIEKNLLDEILLTNLDVTKHKIIMKFHNLSIEQLEKLEKQYNL
jgi:hypothetical protein